jgi:hypothetical protein
MSSLIEVLKSDQTAAVQERYFATRADPLTFISLPSYLLAHHLIGLG